MALDKNDLKEIKKIVKEEVNTSISKTEAYLEDKIEYSISQSEERFEKRFDKTDQKLDQVITDVRLLNEKIDNEVDSLAEFNRTAIDNFNKTEAHDKIIKNHQIRIKKLESKVVG